MEEEMVNLSEKAKQFVSMSMRVRRLLDHNYNLGTCEFRGFPSYLLCCHLCSSGNCLNLVLDYFLAAGPASWRLPFHCTLGD